jgi:nitrate reductase beta subunit
MASLFSAGNTEIVEASYRKLIAVRTYMRGKSVGDIPEKEVEEALSQGKTTAEEAEAIWHLTSMATFDQRFVIPPMAREMAIEMELKPSEHKREAGFGFKQKGERRW